MQPVYAIFHTFFHRPDSALLSLKAGLAYLGAEKKGFPSCASAARNLPAINCNKGENPTSFLKGGDEKQPLTSTDLKISSH